MSSGASDQFPKCPPGSHYDPVARRCVADALPTPCPVGTILDPSTGKCIPDPAWTGGCKKGLDGKCIWCGCADTPGATKWNGAPSNKCPAGTHQSSINKDPSCPGYDQQTNNHDDCCMPDLQPFPQDGPDGKCCSEATLCDGLTDILDQIVKTQQQIAEALAGKYTDCESTFARCRDELDKIIQEKVDAELKKFADCQRMAAAGLCGSVEYNNQCAKYALKCAGEECYQEGIGNIPGKCSKCEKEPCCCNEGKCEPCDEEPKPPGKYHGWCDSITGLVYVTHGEEPAPTPASRSVAIADTEQVAFEEARQYCKNSTGVETPPTQPANIPANAATIGCYLQGYQDGSNLIRLRQTAGDEAFTLGMARVNESIGDIGLAGLTVNDLGQIAQGVLQATLGTPPQLIREYARVAGKLVGCDSEGMIAAITSYSTFGMIEKMTGANLSALTSPYMYSMQSYCRNKFLDPDKAIAAYGANAISREDLDTHWAIHGYCPEALNWYAEAARAKPIPLELMNMKLRGLISEPDYYAGMRKLGYTDQSDSRNLLALRQQIPTMSDIIRFMVRDADDDTLVKQFGLDTGFTQKYQQQLKKWSEQQGVPEQMAKYAWRSHWDIPSPTQLFQFWRRLRKDQKFGGEVKLWNDISAALVQQDILPYWHDHYKAVNFIPLGRVDIRRAFNIGTIPESDLEGLYQQLGYSDSDAKKLAKFAVRDRNNSIGRHKIVKLWIDTLITRQDAVARLTALGFPQQAVDDALNIAQYDFDDGVLATAFASGGLTRQEFTAKLIALGVAQNAADSIADKIGYRKRPGSALRQYQAGIINNQAARNSLTQQGMVDAVAANLISEVYADLKTAQVLACQRSVKRRFLTGDLDKLGAQNALTASGTDAQAAARLVDGWGCEAIANGKNVAIPKLCNWLARGAISPQDFLRRTKLLGYDDVESAMIMDDCLLSTNAKRNAQAKRDAKEQAAESAAQERRAKQLLAQSAQAVAALARGQKAAQATKERRQKQLLSAAEKIIKKCDCDLSKAYAWASDNYKRIQGEYALDKDESLQALIQAADGWDGLDFEQLDNSLNLAASLLQTTEPELTDSGSNLLLN